MSDARSKGICAPGYELMRIYDRDGLVDYYVQNPDWCMERSFPALDVLRSEFSDCENKGVYVGKTFNGEVLNERQTYIFHNCKGTIKVGLNVDKAIIPMLYLANGCRLRILGVGKKIKGNAPRSVVPVYVFGKNTVSMRDNIYVEFNRYNNEIL